MHSTKLKHLALTTLDSAAMRGRVNKSELAEQIYSVIRDSNDIWSQADKREAFLAYLRGGIGELMDERISEDYLTTHLGGNIPPQYMHLLEKLQRFICVNPTLGLHVLAIKATREDWEASARIKRGIAKAVRNRAKDDEDVIRVLIDAKVDSIEELAMLEMA